MKLKLPMLMILIYASAASGALAGPLKSREPKSDNASGFIRLKGYIVKGELRGQAEGDQPQVHDSPGEIRINTSTPPGWNMVSHAEGDVLPDIHFWRDTNGDIVLIMRGSAGHVTMKGTDVAIGAIPMCSTRVA